MSKTGQRHSPMCLGRNGMIVDRLGRVARSGPDFSFKNFISRRLRTSRLRVIQAAQSFTTFLERRLISSIMRAAINAKTRSPIIYPSLDGPLRFSDYTGHLLSYLRYSIIMKWGSKICCETIQSRKRRKAS